MTSFAYDQGLFGRAVTSSTQNTIGGGVKTFTLDNDEGDVFKTDYTVQILANGEPDVFMYGIVTKKVTSVSPAQITVAIFRYSDLVGQYSDWTLQVIAGPFAGLPASQTLGVSTNSAAVPAIGDSLSWTTDTGKAFYDNSTVYVSSVVDPTAFFFATIVSYNSGTGAIKFVANRVGGSGTLALWTIVLIDVQSSFRTTHGDSNYSILSSDNIVALVATLTVNRTWTLPLAASVSPGKQITIVDEVGGVGSKVILVRTSGSDTIGGGVGTQLNRVGGRITFISNGQFNWTFDEIEVGIFEAGLSVLGNNLEVEQGGTFGGDVEIDGLVDLSVGSGQIKFPATQNASADANTLDDYEEGTFTPTLAFATVGTSSWSYATANGSYTKIGNRVFITIDLSFTPTIGTGSGTIRLGGLPFNIDTTVTPIGPTSNWNANWAWSAGRTMVSLAGSNSAFCTFVQNGTAVGASTMTSANLTGGSPHTVQASLVYKAS